jgi:hypothetical protein
MRVSIGCRWGLFGAAYSGLQNTRVVCAFEVIDIRRIRPAFVSCRQHGMISYLQFYLLPATLPDTIERRGASARIRRVLLQTAAVTGSS